MSLSILRRDSYVALLLRMTGKMQPSDEIKQKLDIVDVIREYIQLKAAGMNFRAKCPFHRENTPSFMVSPDKQIWHCFGCGKGGDMFSFVQEIEGINFVEALRVLAPKAGVALKRQDPKLTSERNRILDILELSRKFFHKQLLDSPGAESVRNYLKKRGLTSETIEDWQIGHSPEGWEAISNFLKQRGFQENEIFLSGMTAKSLKRASFFDRFRNRIMFPINDINANTVAFSARVDPAKEEQEKMGKYINSPQTPVYDKSKILFGLDKARLEIKKQDLAVVVEGQLDVISVHQAGFKNVVASSGTALTADQISILKRYSDNIALAFDQDKAGEMAADRGIREAMRVEMNIKVITLPEGMDPDDCIRKDKTVWERTVKDAKPMMEYYFDKILSPFDLSTVEHRREGARLLLPIIAKLGNRIEKDHWLRVLSSKIDVAEDILRETLSVAVSKQRAPVSQSNQKVENLPVADSRPVSREEKLTELLLALIIKYPSLIEYTIKSVTADQLIGDSLVRLYKEVVFYYNNVINLETAVEQSQPLNFDFNDFRTWLDKRISAQKPENENDNKDIKNNQLKRLERLVFLGEEQFISLEEAEIKNQAIKIVLELKKHSLATHKKELTGLIAQAEKEENEEELKELLWELKLLSDELREISN